MLGWLCHWCARRGPAPLFIGADGGPFIAVRRIATIHIENADRPDEVRLVLTGDDGTILGTLIRPRSASPPQWLDGQL